MKTRTIPCTPENAAEMQRVVRGWPELHRLIMDLKEQNLIVGLRSLQITLYGDEKHLAKGLGALPQKNAPKAVLEDCGGLVIKESKA